MAMLCSVTVSMGEDSRGALMVNRRVTLVSNETSDAGKAVRTIRENDL